MDNFATANTGQTGGMTLEYEGYESIPQEDYAIDGSVFQDGFAESGILMHSPFDETPDGDEDSAAEYAEQGWPDRTDQLPADPFYTESMEMEAADFEVSQSGGYEEAGDDAEDGCAYETEVDCGLDESESQGSESGIGKDNGKAGAEGDSIGADTAEDRKRAEHEASEAKRKAEWEARQQARKDAEAAQLARVSVMGDEELVAEAMKRVGADTEKLTRRNMKDCVSEYVQTLCLEDTGFARLAMNPRKTMIRCFRYINRKAREFVEQEMKDNDIKAENGIYGSDVPDDLCYQWAEDYFRDPDAEEDREKEEKFVPKPYMGRSGSRSSSGTSAGKKSAAKKAGAKKADTGSKDEERGKEEKIPDGKSGEGKTKKPGCDGQISFMGQLTLGDFMAQEVKAG